MNHSPAFLALVAEIMPRVKEITVEEWAARKNDFRLIDVREESEYKAGTIPGAESIGRGVLERDIETKAPDKATPLLLYCGGGYRSALAVDSLQKMGYTNVYSLKGGWKAWLSSRTSG